MSEDKSQISKAYQALNQEEPLGSPPELDAAILAQAHKAVQAKPQAVAAARNHLTLRWAAPFASAALIVLSVTVFILTPEVEQLNKQDTVGTYSAQPALKMEAGMADEAVSIEYAAAPRAAPVEAKIWAKKPQRSIARNADSLVHEEMEMLEEPVLAPEQWRKSILQLIEQGQWDVAQQQYKEFSKSYPDHSFNKEYGVLFKQHEELGGN